MTFGLIFRNVHLKRHWFLN